MSSTQDRLTQLIDEQLDLSATSLISMPSWRTPECLQWMRLHTSRKSTQCLISR